MNRKHYIIAGFSLIELAISLLIISISIIPVVLLTGGSHIGEAGKQATLLSKERSVASTLMERATSNNTEFRALLDEYKVLQQKASNKEISTEPIKFPNSETSYKWIFKNLTYSGKNNKRILPDGNFLIDCSLEIYNNESLQTNQKPVITMGTKVLTQIPEKTFDEPIIGIMLLVDMTPSMSMSSCGWGHNPMRVNDLNKYEQILSIDIKDIPTFNEESDPNEVLKFLGKHCNPQLLYNGSFGSPCNYYKNNDDFVFGFNNNNASTDFDERYLPSWLDDTTQENVFATPFDKITNNALFAERYEELKGSIIGSDLYTSCSLINSALSRIEMVRSGLYSFLHLIEKGEAGPSKRFKIGLLPFANTASKADLLEPQTADSGGKFPKLAKYIKSINRSHAPKQYTFDMISTQPYTTDMATALNLAHEALIKDTALTHRVIVLITDWNHCIEIPNTIDIKPVRNCIKIIIKEIQEAELILLEILEKRKANNPNYVVNPKDPILLKLEELRETKEWFLIFITDTEETANSNHQPYHPIYDESCRTITSSPGFNTLAKQISNGTINQAKDQETDIYIFGIVDAARPPAASILANVTTSSKNGEFLVSKDIYQIPELFYYLVSELNRLVKLKESERYSWNKKK